MSKITTVVTFVYILVVNVLSVLRSCHYFGWLRMAEVPEPTSAPALTYLGHLRLLAKKGGSGSMH